MEPPDLTLTYICDSVVEVTWDPVGCTGLYIVGIPNLGVREVLDATKYTTPFLQTEVTYHGWVSAFGGSTSQFTAIGVILSSKF